MMKTLQVCILFSLAAAVFCTNTSAPLLDPVWSADLKMVEKSTGFTGKGFVQFKYDEKHQFIYEEVANGDQTIKVAFWLVEEVVAFLWTPEQHQCTHSTNYQLTIPRDVLQTATYVKTVRGSDIFKDGRVIEGCKATFFTVAHGTNKITEVYMMNTDPDTEDQTMILSNHAAKIDRKWVDVHATCPVIQE